MASYSCQIDKLIFSCKQTGHPNRFFFIHVHVHCIVPANIYTSTPSPPLRDFIIVISSSSSGKVIPIYKALLHVSILMPLTAWLVFIFINLFYPLAAPILKPSVPVQVFDGVTAKVSCSVAKANPLPLFTWEYRNKNCGQNCIWETVPGNLVLTSTNTPTNESVVQVKKDQPNALYRCNASNTVGIDSQTVEFYRLGK